MGKVGVGGDEVRGVSGGGARLTLMECRQTTELVVSDATIELNARELQNSIFTDNDWRQLTPAALIA
ncbi:hypothetical protein ATE48_18360 [Candidatus Viadribacter manganicus]|uniref:Uncharacterized protein n=1 Tax=Candidatus Viadribacter manganicus TaxID=1759059 RepID=A0A1B1AMC6_9PROT|nr:hypothetical protein ATE48_18360 [Candidatus Viadribacter manganicus]